MLENHISVFVLSTFPLSTDSSSLLTTHEMELVHWCLVHLFMLYFFFIFSIICFLSLCLLLLLVEVSYMYHCSKVSSPWLSFSWLTDVLLLVKNWIWNPQLCFVMMWPHSCSQRLSGRNDLHDVHRDMVWVPRKMNLGSVRSLVIMAGSKLQAFCNQSLWVHSPTPITFTRKCVYLLEIKCVK